MTATRKGSWFGPALVAGLAYVVIGRVFALPTTNVQVWRLAAWAASGVVFAAHIAYEHYRLGQRTLTMAVHTAVGVAFGAIGLAVAAMVYRVTIGTPVSARWLVALVVWPAVTGIPAFLAALVAGAVLRRFARIHPLA